MPLSLFTNVSNKRIRNLGKRMYSFFRGILIEASPSFAVLDVHGVGYKLLIPTSLFPKLPPLSAECLLHVSYIVRELSATLYGFLEPEERNIFEILQNVTGVGPKMALNLIGHLDPSHLHRAIHQNNLEVLCKVPGVGKKTAERLIVELRDKLSYIPNELKLTIEPNQASVQNDAINALVNLGYHLSIAQKAIKKSLTELPDNCDLSLLITHSLKNV
ncbi:Holliday junction ATP-dependent DNA helicase RuvA [Chlamydiales bacterium STE3]|nr:Holliday junction ATP-dependent DNA helicase RuvA [Chlamydiales bacterium STE3]